MEYMEARMQDRYDGFDKEMQTALAADGEKLRALTGEDHGPWFIVDEAHIDGAPAWQSYTPQLPASPNLVGFSTVPVSFPPVRS